MKQRWAHMTLRPMLALGLAAGSWGVLAQDVQTDLLDWRQANEAVGQFPRGHADVLRWEQSQTPRTVSAASEVTAAFRLASADAAVRAAWSARRELINPLAQVGRQDADHIASGHWGLLDPVLQRRIHGLDKLLEVAATTRKAWFTAVAARETVEHLENALTAAEAAAELGQRMVRVGNWGRYQLAPLALGESSARQELRRAHLAAQQAEWALLKTLGLDTVHDGVALPSRLPEAPSTPLGKDELRQRLEALQKHLPLAERRQAGRNATQAYAAYTASIDAYRSFREDVLRQREIISEETLFRYNGMLESTWGLLADVGARSQAVVATIDAQRTALIAETDLQWVLQGGRPDAFVSLGGGAQGAAAQPGH